WRRNSALGLRFRPCAARRRTLLCRSIATRLLRVRSGAVATKRARSDLLKRSKADAGLGQHKAHIVSRCIIARKVCCDRTDLFIAGQQQESRCPAVALDAGSEIVRLGMGELAPAMRWNRAAIMDIRIDERPKHACAFDNGVKG